MGIARILLPFDLDGFRKEISPVLSQMHEGDFQGLMNLARKIGKNNQGVWSFLDYFGYYEDDLGREDFEFDNEEVKITFWINVILASHCIAYPQKTPNAREIQEILTALLVKDEFMSLLIKGRHIGELLLPDFEMCPAFRGREKTWPSWSSHFGNWGWLANADLVQMQEKINLINLVSVEEKWKSQVDEIREMLSWCIQKSLGLIVGVST
jgi:hypothetical protein